MLGVLVMTGEYATGWIRSTLAAAPQRVTVLAPRRPCSLAHRREPVPCHRSPARRSSAPTKFTPPSHLLAPWTGFAVFCGYAPATLIAAAITLSRRDA